MNNNKLIERIDKRFTSFWNVRGRAIQDPDETELIEINREPGTKNKITPYYNAKEIDKLDEVLWMKWRKFIEGLKETPSENSELPSDAEKLMDEKKRLREEYIKQYDKS